VAKKAEHGDEDAAPTLAGPGRGQFVHAGSEAGDQGQSAAVTDLAVTHGAERCVDDVGGRDLDVRRGGPFALVSNRARRCSGRPGRQRASAHDVGCSPKLCRPVLHGEVVYPLLSSMNCARSVCTAIGFSVGYRFGALAVKYAHGRWSSPDQITTATGGRFFMANAVSCRAPGVCTAVGHHVSAADVLTLMAASRT